MTNRSLLALVALTVVAPFSSSAQNVSSLRQLEGTDPTSGTEYTRILLTGSSLANSPLAPVDFTGTPTLIAQCTRSSSGKQAFDLFVSFGDATDLEFHAPIAPSPEHPRPQRVDLRLDFSGYTHIPLRRQFETLSEPNGMLRYASPGLHSANLDEAPIMLRYLVALPTLRLTNADRTATFDTLPLLSAIRSEPLCKAALL